MLHKGTITVWIPSRRFGFISPEDGSDRVFLHTSRIKSGLPVIGLKARYEISPIREGSSPTAINVEILNVEDGAL